MNPAALLPRPTPRRLLVAALAAALVVGVLTYRANRGTQVVAHFDTAPGIYEGDDVKVLGVKVGKVGSIEHVDGGVDITLVVDDGQKLPKEASAAIVSPSLVSGRFVQLAPAWTGGPTLDDGDEIPEARTAVPVSFDDVKQELTDLTSALGPRNPRERGALDQAVRTVEANLAEGRSGELREAVAQLHDAAASLSSGRSDLFTTVRNLNAFTRNLAVHDAAVGGFTTELDQVSSVLRNNRTQITSAVRELRAALAATGGVLDDNRAQLDKALRGASTLTGTVASRADELAGVLHVAPHSLMGLYNIVDQQAITGRAVLANADSIAALLCGAVLGAGGTEQQCQLVLRPLVDLLGLDGAAKTALSHGLPTSPSPPPAPAPGPVGPGVVNDLLSQLGLGGLL